MLLTLTGCVKKTAITTNDFKSVANNHGYTISDATSQYAIYGYINEATIAKSSEGWQVEFYVLDDEASATNMFNTNKTLFEASKENSSSEKSLNSDHSSSYSLTSSDSYMYICRVDNTLVYVKVLEKYKNTVKDFIKELGY